MISDLQNKKAILIHSPVLSCSEKNKVILIENSILYPTLPYPTLPYPTLPYPTLPYPTHQHVNGIYTGLT
jgi:hypothetical protein